MKNQIKKIGSMLAAVSVLTSTFAGSAFALQSEDTTTASTNSLRDYLLQEDFSNFQNGGNGSDNNRIDQWRIEGEDVDGNATPRAEHLNVEEVSGMGTALVMKNRVQILRGGRDWTADKYVQPGETVVIEFDIKPDAASKFIFGLHSDKNTQVAEDAGGQAAFMYLKPDDENVYVFPTQNRNDGINQNIGNVTIKKNEVNHVKVEYTVNKDISKGTYDTLVMTVANSAGISTGTKNVNYRADNSNSDITGIRGINFWKDDKTGTLCLDNIEVYKSTENALLDEDFKGFKNGGNGSDNNRIDKWRIEGEDGDGNATPRAEHLNVEKVSGMGTALVMKNRVQILRGGRDWTADKYVQPGETVVIEFDIKPDDASKFIFGLHSAKNTQVAEDAGGHAAFMYLKPNVAKVYVFDSPNRNDSTTETISGVTIKKNEVNHVKVKYTVNKDISQGTKDTLVMTVTNSDGTSTGTKKVNYRTGNANDITGIRGINFWKDDKTGTLCLANIKAYKDNTLIEEDFSNFQNGGNGDYNNRIDTWRVEQGDNDPRDRAQVVTEKEMTGALKIGTDLWMRGGKLFTKNITAGQTITVEADVCAEADSHFVMGLGTSKHSQKIEDQSGHSMLFAVKPNTENIYFGNNQNMNFDSDRVVPNVVFKKGEVNHIKAVYTLNRDVSYGTTDTLKLTVTNSAGTKEATVNTNYRSGASDNDKAYALTGISGINFIKFDSTTYVWLDNIKVYCTETENAVPQVRATANDGVTVDLGKNVSSIDDGEIYLYSNGAKVNATGTLNSDRTYTFSGAELTAGKEYKAVIPAGITAEDGTKVKASKLTFVPVNSTTTVAKDQETIDVTADLTVSVTAATDKVGKGATVVVAGYNTLGKLVGAQLKKDTLTATTKTFKFNKNTITAADSYKIFVWDTATFEPLCNNL